MNKTVSVVMPCLNEASTVGPCVSSTREILNKHQLQGEIIVVDNGSTDDSAVIAQKCGASVIFEPIQGYGSAYLKGLQAIKGDFIVMGDSDGTYDFREIPKLIEPLYKGYDMVIGSRTKGNIQPGAMPWLHRYLGTPLLSRLLNFFYKLNLSDINSGMRAFTKSAYQKMSLTSSGMEFASEMLIKARHVHLKIAEVPIAYSVRKGKSKLNSFSDGWRHLSLILAYSSTRRFMLPGFLCLMGGTAISGLLALGPLKIGTFKFDYHYMMAATLTTILSFQILSFLFLAKTFLAKKHQSSQDVLFHVIHRFISLHGIKSSMISISVGFLLGLSIIYSWVHTHFGELNKVRTGLLCFTFLIMGLQLLFATLFLKIIDSRDS
ncbi:MAG: hypothetical protein A2Z91_06985 [Deltaproteobacteria bacterium GWA2_38_16]|nr:MAG: hypothetical protein A2Z91_06985 [Deltaproteobacteria bacterium GWA2_38_16]OGQ02384.1 MAG: hypothetical protein A3D19_06040 [Deltaproteobacteria bacterium RIFCSPHIGHO2_02_FULL_38_15]OGQ62346.1 MAG: hypothetical protein A3G92_06290 [Deltaproteobacteria bacterium RIFCSPLOWO2_12_FULL_38_8]HBQ20719.1 dolichol-P-glucose synthetase [Deltaproteobacteria bacterium]